MLICIMSLLMLLPIQRRNLGSIAKVLQHASAGKLVSCSKPIASYTCVLVCN